MYVLGSDYQSMAIVFCSVCLSKLGGGKERDINFLCSSHCVFSMILMKTP